MSRLFLLVSVIACCASVALAGDRTLGTVSGPCKDQFSTIIRDHYATDSTCADTIKKAMTTVPNSDSDCPGGAQADAGSSVQKCMSKDQVGVCVGVGGLTAAIEQRACCRQNCNAIVVKRFKYCQCGCLCQLQSSSQGCCSVNCSAVNCSLAWAGLS